MTAEVTAKMNVDSRGYVSCSGDYFTGSGVYILIRRVNERKRIDDFGFEEQLTRKNQKISISERWS